MNEKITINSSNGNGNNSGDDEKKTTTNSRENQIVSIELLRDNICECIKKGNERRFIGCFIKNLKSLIKHRGLPTNTLIQSKVNDLTSINEIQFKNIYRFPCSTLDSFVCELAILQNFIQEFSKTHPDFPRFMNEDILSYNYYDYKVTPKLYEFI